MTAGVRGVLPMVAAVLWQHSYAVPGVITARGLIASELGVAAGLWIAPAYLILYASLLLLGGRLADLFGPRRVLISSLALLVASMVISGIVSNGPLIVALSGLRGAATACSIPAAQAILTTRYYGQDKTKAVAISTGIGVTGFLAALLATSVLADYGWRLPVLAPIPVAALALLLAVRYRDIPMDEQRQSLDVWGAILLAAAMIALVRAIFETRQSGWTSPTTLGAFGASAVLFAIFVVVESRTTSPIFPLAVLRRGVDIGRVNVFALCLDGAHVGSLTLVTGYLSRIGWSPLGAAAAYAPMGIFMGLMPFMAPVIRRYGAWRLLGAGAVISVGAYANLLRLGPGAPEYWAVIVWTPALAGVAYALAWPPLVVLASSAVDAQYRGLAAGLMWTAYQLGGAVAAALADTLLTADTGVIIACAVLCCAVALPRVATRSPSKQRPSVTPP
jgi:MFS family permease